MMHIFMIFDPDACICDAGFFPDERTNKGILGVGCASMILNSDACVYDARIYVACVYDPRSLTLMHMCMMHVYDP